MDDDKNNDPLLERAKTVLADGSYRYAIFLYREILKKYPENLEIRAELHKIRKCVHFKKPSLFSLLYKLYVYTRVLYAKKKKRSAAKIIDEIENLIDCDPTNFAGYRMIASVADAAKMYNLAEFSMNEIPREAHTRDDLLTIAEILLNQKKFDQSLKIANSLLEKNPDDFEAKDIVWKSSVDKQMHQKVNLVMADGIKRVTPPKVEASEIVMSNQKSEDKENTESAKQKKHNEAFR